MMATIILDTNIFLECKELSNLPWSDITKDDEITLLVPLGVVDEVDQKKTDKNGRIRSKAIRAAKLFEDVLESASVYVLRKGSPRLEVRLMPVIKTEGTGDTQILLETKEAIQGLPDSMLLSGDIGMRIRAKSQGIVCEKPPPTWIASFGPDEKDQKIAKLERRIDDLERARPSLVITVRWDGQPTTNAPIEILLELALPFTGLQLDAIVEEVERRYPNQSPKEALGLLGVTGFRYERYNEEYSKFLDSARRSFEMLHSRLAWRQSIRVLSIALDNKGTAPARGVSLAIEASGNVSLFPKDAKLLTRRRPFRLPNPPELSADMPFGIDLPHFADTMIPELDGLTPTDPDEWFTKLSLKDSEYRSLVEKAGRLQQGFMHEVEVQVSCGTLEGHHEIRIQATADELVEPVHKLVPVRVRCRSVSLGTVLEGLGGASEEAKGILQAIGLNLDA